MSNQQNGNKNLKITKKGWTESKGVCACSSVLPFLTVALLFAFVKLKHASFCVMLNTTLTSYLTFIC